MTVPATMMNSNCFHSGQLSHGACVMVTIWSLDHAHTD